MLNNVCKSCKEEITHDLQDWEINKKETLNKIDRCEHSYYKSIKFAREINGEQKEDYYITFFDNSNNIVKSTTRYEASKKNEWKIGCIEFKENGWDDKYKKDTNNVQGVVPKKVCNTCKLLLKDFKEWEFLKSLCAEKVVYCCHINGLNKVSYLNIDKLSLIKKLDLSETISWNSEEKKKDCLEHNICWLIENDFGDCGHQEKTIEELAEENNILKARIIELEKELSNKKNNLIEEHREEILQLIAQIETSI